MLPINKLASAGLSKAQSRKWEPLSKPIRCAAAKNAQKGTRQRSDRGEVAMLSTVRAGLAKFHDSKLVDELIEAYVEAKRSYYLGGLRLSAVEGGRFCEAAYRILASPSQFRTFVRGS